MPTVEERKTEIKRLSDLIDLNKQLRSTLENLKTQSLQTSLPLYDGLAFQPATIVQSTRTTLAMGQGYFVEMEIDDAKEVIDRRVEYIESLIAKETKLVELLLKINLLNGEELNEDGDKFVEIREDVVPSTGPSIRLTEKVEVVTTTNHSLDDFDLNLLKRIEELEIEDEEQNLGIQVLDSDGEDVMKKHTPKNVKFSAKVSTKPVSKKEIKEVVSILKGADKTPKAITQESKAHQHSKAEYSKIPDSASTTNEETRPSKSPVKNIVKERVPEIIHQESEKQKSYNPKIEERVTKSQKPPVSLPKKAPAQPKSVFKGIEVIEHAVSDSDDEFDSEDDLETQLVRKQIAVEYHRKRQQLISAGLIKGDLEDEDSSELEDYGQAGSEELEPKQVSCNLLVFVQDRKEPILNCKEHRLKLYLLKSFSLPSFRVFSRFSINGSYDRVQKRNYETVQIEKYTHQHIT